MTFLVLTFFLIMFLGLIIPEKKNHLFLAIVLVILTFIRTFVDVYSVPDLDNYLGGFLQIKAAPNSSVATVDTYPLKCPELGYRYLMKFCSYIGDFRFLLFVLAVYSIMSYFNVLRKYSPYLLVSIALFYLIIYVYSIFVLRQHLSMAIAFFSYKYIINRDWKRFFLCMLLAFSMHQTALVFVPVYFLYGIKRPRTLFLTFVVIVSVLSVMSYVWLDNLSLFFEGYSHYENSRGNTLTTLFISIVVLLVYVFSLRGAVFNDGVNRIVFICLVLYFGLLLTSWNFLAINRLILYFSSAVVLSVPIAMKNINNNWIRRGVCFCAVALYFYLAVKGSGANSLVSFDLDLSGISLS